MTCYRMLNVCVSCNGDYVIPVWCTKVLCTLQEGGVNITEFSFGGLQPIVSMKTIDKSGREP